MRVLLPALALLTAWILLLLGLDPVPTWFYVFAWYPTLALLDGIATRLDGRKPLLADVRLALSLLAWSPVIWLLFEMINLRIGNWYYVYLPRGLIERWAGILLSFATVVPAITLAERLLDAAGVGRRWRRRPIPPGIGNLQHLVWIGGVALIAILLLPHSLYPLTWGALLLVADPLVYRQRPDLSLIADLERGHWGRVARLMLGGLLIGGIWEVYNSVARGKWIYTVPLLEQFKWFEMPPLGFLGFPFFALEAWAMYHALCVFGLATPVRGETSMDEQGRARTSTTPHVPARLRSSALVYAAAAVFSIATLLGMERWTISSTEPTMAFASAPELTSPWKIASMDAATLAAQVGVSTDSARRIVERARLVTLRGIGTEHADQLAAMGVATMCGLAKADPGLLWRRLHDGDPAAGPRPTAPEVRVWVRAAGRACQPE